MLIDPRLNHGISTVQGIADIMVVLVIGCPVPPHVVLPGNFPIDLGNVRARQDHCDQLRDGQEDADARVHDHHGDHVIVQLGLDHRQTSVDKDLVPDLGLLLPEDVNPTSLRGIEAAAVWHGEVFANGSVPEVVVAGVEVVSSAALEVRLQLVPFGSDGAVFAVHAQVAVNLVGTDVGLGDGSSQLEGGEDGHELGDEGDGQKDGVDCQETSTFGAGDQEAVDSDDEGVDACGEGGGREREC